MFDYDVVISFAGQQRAEAKAIASCLRKSGAKVFYDDYEKANLWGRNLYDHLADIYQNKGRYCLMLVSADYAAKAWPNHERQNAQARALVDKTGYILPVRFDNTVVPGLPLTISYVRFQDEGAEGICQLLLERLGQPLQSESELPSESVLAKAGDDPQEYWEERKRLPETPVQQAIWSKARWRTWVRPMEFKPARFRDLQHCTRFVQKSRVQISGWQLFPWVSDTVEMGAVWVSGEADIRDRTVHHTERWTLFRSGQFLQYRAFDEIPQLRHRTHALEILRTIAAAFEFAARMAAEGVLAPQARISFELANVAGRALTWPQDQVGDNDFVPRQCWCQDDTFSMMKETTGDELQSKKLQFALELSVDAFMRFGWKVLPRERLTRDLGSAFAAMD